RRLLLRQGSLPRFRTRRRTAGRAPVPSKWPAMILDSLEDRKRSIELLEEDQTGQRVGEREGSERQSLTAFRHQFRGQSEVGTEEEDDRPRPLRAPGRDLRRQRLRV